MHKKDIECAELVRGGIKLTAKDGRTALLKFRDSERLRSASPKQRVSFRLFFGGLRWDDIDEDLSYDSIFEPQASVSGLYISHPEIDYFNVKA
jgi:hypothetical protein